MATEFGVLNPLNGTVTRVGSVEEAKSLFVERAVAFVSEHFHSTAFVEIELNDNGTETWKNAEGAEIEPILTYEQLVAAMQAAAEQP